MSKKSHRFTALRAFFTFAKPYRLHIAISSLIFFIAGAFIAVIPVIIGMLVDALSQPNPNTTYVWWLAGALGATSVLHDIAWRGGEFYFRAFVNKVGFLYETHLFEQVIKQPYPYFTDKFSGKIGSNITTISSEIKTFLSDLAFEYSNQLLGVIATLLILSTLNWQSAVVFVAGLAGMIFVGRYTLAKSMFYEAKETDVNADKNGLIFDAIANFASVKSFRTEKAELDHIHVAQTKTLAAAQTSFFWGIVFWGSMSLFVRHVIWTVLVIMNVWFYFQGSLSVGQLATLLSTILIFTNTIWEAVWYVSQFGTKMARIDEAYTYLFNKGDSAVQISAGTVVSAKHTFNRSLKLQHIEFAYPDQKHMTVLHDISFDIQSKEKIGIVGKSGSGKSTLTKLLLNFYEPTSGKLYLDGQQTNAAALAELISFVPQDTSLFHRTIAQNIAYGSPNATKEQIITAAKQAEAHDFIVNLTQGYDTLVGERGVKLSGGQRQRIAIARAVLQNKPILLLDEATSALDSESEIAIQKAIANLWQDRTVVAIAHRLSTLKHTDRIIVLDDGHIIEQGSHSQLITQGGTYAQLWAHQSGGFIEE